MKLIARPDFLNTKVLLSRETADALATTPHLLTDSFGNLLSSFQPDSLPPETLEILLGTTPIAKLRAPHNLRELLRNMLQAEFLQEYKSLQLRQEKETGDLLADDFEELLRISEIDAMPFESQLEHFLKILRTHVWVEKASIFGIYDGFSLEALAGIGGTQDPSTWLLDFSSVAGVAASTRKPYHSEDLKNDTNFRAKEGMEIPRNIFCFPLLHGTTLVGVLNLCNRIGGAFEEIDFVTIRRFSRIAAHLLQKQFLKKRMESFERSSGQLGKYLSSKVAKSVTSSAAPALGGTEKKVVCLFSDIRGYTSITEDIGAATLVKLLNFHFERMSAILEKYEGTLDKIVGDLIMAVWNMPNDQPDPELLAMKAALEMQKEMIRVVAPEWAKNGVPKVGMGVGVNSGIALVGNLGSSRFMNYTVIGDAVNTAQRLESKAQPGEIWMAEQMFEMVQGKLEKPARKECDIRLKGKDKTINAFVYRPLSY
jgi:class 3 adenylate cyclase